MANSKPQSGPGFPLSVANDALTVLNFTHGGGLPGQSPLTAAQNLTQQEQRYAPSGPVKTSLQAENTALTGGQDVTTTLGKALAFLTSTSNWLRLGEILAGAVLLLFGLMQLRGTSATGTAKKAARVAL